MVECHSGARIVSAVPNMEASASWRLLMYLWHFQSITQQVSTVAWVSVSQRVEVPLYMLILPLFNSRYVSSRDEWGDYHSTSSHW